MAAEIQDRTGQVIAGRYQVVKPLGQGAFGTVWLANQLDQGRQVVLKLLHPQWAQVPAIVERFRREAVASNRVNHPNVCHVYDYNVTPDGIPYIAMEFLSGQPLSKELERQHQLPLSRVAEIMGPVCEAVAAAHQAQIIHRDLKPENIMMAIRENGKPAVPVVLDFGIAKLKDAAEKLTQTGSMMGTPTYMSPEQCRGLTDISPAADVYALAIMTYEMLVGTVPFNAKTVAEVAMKHVLEPPPKLTGVPPALTQLVDACLGKEPKNRPSAAQLAAGLRQAAGQQPQSMAGAAASGGGPAPAAQQSQARAPQATVMTGSTNLPKGPPPAKSGVSVGIIVLIVVTLLAVGGLVLLYMTRS